MREPPVPRPSRSAGRVGSVDSVRNTFPAHLSVPELERSGEVGFRAGSLVPSRRRAVAATVPLFQNTVYSISFVGRRDPLMRIAVLGAGAIGAYAGAALHRGGAEVHLIARGPHLEALRSGGVRVLSPRGDFTAHPPATDDPAEVGPVDYVLLGLKAQHYADCGPLLAPLLGPDTAVVAAQNGIPWWYFH